VFSRDNGAVSAPQTAQAAQLAGELGKCRQRGLDKLDVDTPPQSPIRAEQLESLTRDYCTRTAPELHGRIACIKKLLNDALDAYGNRGNHADADLITTLFFGDPNTPKALSAGEMLKLAMKQRNLADEKKFQEDRRLVFAKFAEFLIPFASESPVSASESSPAHRPRAAVIAAIALVVLVAAGVGIWWNINQPIQSTASTSGPSLPPSTKQMTPHPPPLIPGRTYTEAVSSTAGARTYTNPYNLSGEGPRIDNGKNVQVSCKLTFASPGSSGVGLYWYRIASPPSNNQYYSPANSFLNGDPIKGLVDEAVPDCPA